MVHWPRITPVSVRKIFSTSEHQRRRNSFPRLLMIHWSPLEFLPRLHELKTSERETKILKRKCTRIPRFTRIIRFNLFCSFRFPSFFLSCVNRVCRVREKERRGRKADMNCKNIYFTYFHE